MLVAHDDVTKLDEIVQYEINKFLMALAYLSDFAHTEKLSRPKHPNR